MVVTGRVADPALTLALLVHHFRWAMHDWDKLAAGTLAGHLLECGAQITGGYFADPGRKDVPNLAEVGFPIAEVWDTGEIVIGKAANTGGVLNEQTVKEQLLYEIHAPSAYLTPDVVLDITQVTVDTVGPNRVRVRGARGKPRPDTLKATLSVAGGWLGEGEISYAGPNAAGRARLAAEVLRQRLDKLESGIVYRIDLIGIVSIFDGDEGALRATMGDVERDDVRVRLAVAGDNRQLVDKAANQVSVLYCTGPAGGGGVRSRVTPRIKTASYLLPRERPTPKVTLLETQFEGEVTHGI